MKTVLFVAAVLFGMSIAAEAQTCSANSCSMNAGSRSVFQNQPLRTFIGNVLSCDQAPSYASYPVVQSYTVANCQPTPAELAPVRPACNQIISQPTYQTRYLGATSGGNSALEVVNMLRQRRGLRALQERPSLTAIAHQKASIQANRGMMYHPGGTMGGARYEGVGMGQEFVSCYLYDSTITYAGAATVTGSNGQQYHALLAG